MRRVNALYHLLTRITTPHRFFGRSKRSADGLCGVRRTHRSRSASGALEEFRPRIRELERELRRRLTLKRRSVRQALVGARTAARPVLMPMKCAMGVRSSDARECEHGVL